jgi:radical SAM superfamily enzyme YgiQ (UPF0313 family)
MRVLFISANTEKINIPTLPLGLACVASATQHSGHDVALVDLMVENDMRRVLKGAIRGFRPDVIGISVRNIDDQNMENPRFLLGQVEDVVAVCRSLSGANIVLGGAGYSIFPESALSFLGADMGIQGEGEVAFPAVINRLSRGAELTEIPGLYLSGRKSGCRRVFAKNLNQLPLPDTDLWSLPRQRENLWMPVQTRRGCPLDCSYCSTGTIEGRVVRKRSPEAVARWIALWRRAGIRQFYFVDNTFNLPPAYAKVVCRKLIDHHLDIKWWSILYPKDVDKEMVELMASAGCEQVSLGFESGSRRVLKRLNKRFSPEEVRRVSKLLSDQGLKQMGFLLLGGPGETRQSVEESLVFADSLGLDMMKITTGVRIYPYTPLSKVALEKGIIPVQDDLLFPRFYLEKAVEDWLPDALRKWAATRPHWQIQG